MPLVSIIVPAFNVAKTLPATLNALLAQTFTDYEIIVVDDGSTDTTAALLEEYAGIPNFKVISQRNRGLAGARNTGIAAARGLYIGFCDADDLWVPEKLGCHVAHLHSAPHVGISYSGSALIDDDGAPLGMAQTPASKTSRLSISSNATQSATGPPLSSAKPSLPPSLTALHSRRHATGTLTRLFANPKTLSAGCVLH
ncbi:glycosyltransferase family 2 protein [Sulfitobacter pacificus]|uniref:glycosyltransferase family 2 protein n=1 Tax=Sulfitobacter pacificus TaxID=1499314 RepID=UPI00361CFB12